MFPSKLINFSFLIQFLSETSSLSLNPVESFLLKKRLSKIQNTVKNESFQSTSPLHPKTDNKSHNLILIFPGAGGPDAFTRELETTISEITKDTAPSPTIVSTLDWGEFRGSLLTAAFDGEAFGESIGHVIWERFKIGGSSDDTSTLRSIHCIGISVGAFGGNACARTLCRTRSGSSRTGGGDTGPHVRLTLLDPFTSRGVWGTTYGQDNFGLDADFAEQYLNTDDPVPTTNDPLRLCSCVDVTGATERESFILPDGETMHCWPLVYFARYGYKKEGAILDNNVRLMYHGEGNVPEKGCIQNL